MRIAFDLKKSESDSQTEVYIPAFKILSFAVKNGLTVADFKSLSIGFIIDFCLENSGAEKDDCDAEKYQKLKDIVKFVDEDYQNGDITEDEYLKFKKNYQRLEDQYGWNY